MNTKNRPVAGVPLSGSLRFVSLSAIVQLLVNLKATGTLHLEEDCWRGSVRLADGRVVAATFDGDHGANALDAMTLVLGQADFVFVEGRPPAYPSTPISAASLVAIFDGLELERRQIRASVPSLAAVPRVLEQQGPNDDLTLSVSALKILIAVDGRATVAEIGRGHGVARTMRVMASLVDLGLVEVGAPRDVATEVDTDVGARVAAGPANGGVAEVGGMAGSLAIANAAPRLAPVAVRALVASARQWDPMVRDAPRMAMRAVSTSTMVLVQQAVVRSTATVALAQRLAVQHLTAGRAAAIPMTRGWHRQLWSSRLFAGALTVVILVALVLAVFSPFAGEATEQPGLTLQADARAGSPTPTATLEPTLSAEWATPAALLTRIALTGGASQARADPP